ncbi:hypothetical protein Vretimale_19104 [Volvox reticuliferus]|uniref:Uncharacterized protein n=1 Tax=Volvox reticuliferus TaxID=1737510 RepID=A0A8J4D541_9CHLO|nr:hypothetical protein Vretifemale_20547 [Volvox reticuliferus]GIM16470.1 hypothetical protein Vretimale_19104 [Volvox reticuliferus]
MIAITIDDEEDAEFQADLARAIAASLEPDLPGPLDEIPRADNTGWNALLAVGQAATLGSSGLNARCSSPALLATDDIDADFQRQMAAALAASIQSAEEDRRRREVGGIPPQHRPLPVQDPAYVLQQGNATQAIWQLPPQQQQPQGFLAGNGSFCCSSGLVLKPLAAARASSSAPQAPISASPCRAMAPATWASSFRNTAALALGPAAEADGAADGEIEMGRDVALANGCPAYPLQPARSPGSSEGDSAAPVGITFGAGAATRCKDPLKMLQAEPAMGGTVRAGSAPVQLSSSPGKHGRTPSLTAVMDPLQPQMKRSRPGSDSGVAQPSIPGEALGCEDLRRRAAAWQQQRETSVVTGMTWGGSAGGGGCRTASDEKVPVPSAQLHSPPERPASAASCCTAPMACGVHVLEDCGDCGDGSTPGYADVGLQVPAASMDDSWRVATHSGSLPFLPPSHQRQQQAGENGKDAALSGVSLVGQEPGSGAGPLPLNLSWGGRSAGHLQQVQMQLSSRNGPPPARVPACEVSNGMTDVIIQHEQHLTAPGRRSDCSEGGRPRSRGSSASASTAPTAEGALCGLAHKPSSAGGSDPMITDSHAAVTEHAGVGMAAVDVVNVPSGAGPAEASTPVWGWGYSGAERRMLLQQRVWWWLGPGQVQSGHISSIDRRSEPLLYSVRLDSVGPGTERQTIIATADCLFPYLSHGDKLMCRLPPSASGSTTCNSNATSVVSRNHKPAAAAAQQRRQQLEEWPGFYGTAGLGSGAEGDSGGGVAAATGAGPCAWMLGTLQHCIFDGREPMVHVLLGPEQLPYSAPYEFVVPVSDAAEGSGCTPAAVPPASAAALPDAVGTGGFGSALHFNTCTEIVPFGRVA